MRLPKLVALLLFSLLFVACAQASSPPAPLASAAASVAASAGAIASDAKATLCASSGPGSLTQLATDLDKLGSGSASATLRQDLATRIGAIATQLRGLQLTADAATLRDQVSTNLGTLATTVATASPDPSTVAQAAQLVRQLQQNVCV